MTNFDAAIKILHGAIEWAVGQENIRLKAELARWRPMIEAAVGADPPADEEHEKLEVFLERQAQERNQWRGKPPQQLRFNPERQQTPPATHEYSHGCFCERCCPCGEYEIPPVEEHDGDCHCQQCLDKPAPELLEALELVHGLRICWPKAVEEAVVKAISKAKGE